MKSTFLSSIVGIIFSGLAPSSEDESMGGVLSMVSYTTRAEPAAVSKLSRLGVACPREKAPMTTEKKTVRISPPLAPCSAIKYPPNPNPTLYVPKRKKKIRARDKPIENPFLAPRRRACLSLSSYLGRKRKSLVIPSHALNHHILPHGFLFFTSKGKHGSYG